MNSRTIQLLGKENFEKIANLKIAVFGLGGVGGTCFEALVRSGVSKFYIQDFDEVNESNLNRQILFNLNDIGQKKCSSAAIFAKNINKNVEIIANDNKLTRDFSLEFLKDYDFVVDAIDDIDAKIYLLSFCVKNNIKVISSLGMGKKLDPSKVHICKLNKTTMDPLAKKLRYLLKKEEIEISNIYCAFTDEIPSNSCDNNIISSMIFVPSSAGLNMAHFIIKTLLDN